MDKHRAIEQAKEKVFKDKFLTANYHAWTDVFKSANLKGPQKIIDCGAAVGTSLIVAAEMNLLEKGLIIDPNYTKLNRRHNIELKPLGIEVIEVSFEEFQGSLEEFDVLIKTFNGLVLWPHYLGGLDLNNKTVISSNCDFDEYLNTTSFKKKIFTRCVLNEYNIYKY